MRKIGLIDIDSKIPNLALMKISTYHKNKGDNVEWWKGSLFNNIYDKTYASKVFDFSKFDIEDFPKGVEIGGSGYDLKKRLPNEIECMDLDYCIYPDCDYSVQRFSVGCNKNCGFCVVRKKEGLLKPIIVPMNLNPKGKRIVVIDNNFFANPLWKDAINYLEKTNQPVDFQGIDARDLTKEQAKALLGLKHYKQIHMAWDNPKDDIDWAKIISWIKSYRIMVYVLIGYNTTKEEDLYRVETLRSYKLDPFVMPYDKFDSYQKRFARWVNHKAIFKSVKWEEYQSTPPKIKS